MAPPSVPGEGESFHTAQDIQDYAAWLQARFVSCDLAIGAGTGLAYSDLEPLAPPAFVFAIAASTAPVPAKALYPGWLTFHEQWDADYQNLKNGQPMIHVPTWLTIATVGVADAIAMGLTVGNFFQGKDDWSQLKSYHRALLEWVQKWKNLAVVMPDIPDVPGAPKGGPSSTTLAIFSVGVAILGAYVGWELAPTEASKPAGAAIGAAVGGGATFLALR